MCVFSSHPFWTSSSLDVPAGVTQEEGHTGFLIHLPSAVRALIFVARRIQPFLSLVDREVEFWSGQREYIQLSLEEEVCLYNTDSSNSMYCRCQEADPRCSLRMEMSRMTRDGTGRPNPFRDTKFSGANANREVLFFPV